MARFGNSREHHVIFVGPEYLQGFGEFAGLDRFRFLPIHPKKAREHRLETEEALRGMLEEVRGQAVVLLQAGTLAPYWILRLRKSFPNTRWIDGGLALSICAPVRCCCRKPWGRASIDGRSSGFYNRWVGSGQIPERDMFHAVSSALAKATAEPSNRHGVDFVENKKPDQARIAQFLAASEAREPMGERRPRLPRSA